MEQDNAYKDIFDSINKEDDFAFEKSIDKAKLFIKIFDALSTINKFPFDEKKLKIIYSDLDYNYNKYQASYDPVFYEDRINLIIRRNFDIIMKIINFYYEYIKDATGSGEEDF